MAELEFIDVSTDANFNKKWSDLTDALKKCVDTLVKPEITGTRVFSHWVYEVDPQSLLGKITGNLKARSGTYQGKIRCWTIGINAFQMETNANGSSDILGGRNNAWKDIITIDIWGFFENDGTSAAANSAIHESRLVKAQIWRNAPMMQERLEILTELRPLIFTPVQPQPFSDGKSVIVASGSMTAYVKENLTIQE